MPDLGSRRGAAEKLGLPLMVVTFLLVAGFLYWLNVTAQPTEVLIAETGGDTETGIQTVTLDDLMMNPATYEGQEVRITDARVASHLGTSAFWAGPDDNPFLAKLSADLLTAGVSVTAGETVTFIGTVTLMGDSILNDWQEAGVFQSEGDRIVAEFAERFVEVRTVEGRGGEAGEGGDAGES